MALLSAALVALAGAAAAQQPEAAVFFIRHAPPIDVDAPSPIAVAPGEHTTAPLYVTNRGNATETLRFGLLQAVNVAAGADGGSAGPSLAMRLTPSTVTLGPGETAELTLSIFAFPDTPLGTYPLYLDVNAGGSISIAQYGLMAEVVEPTPAEATLPQGTLAAATVAFAGGGAWLALRRLEWLRYALLGGLLPLYSRLAPSRLLEQEKRDLLHRLVKDEPGIHFSALKERTGLPNGVLVHHLRTLERHRLITSRRDGPLRRFAATPAAFPAPTPRPVTPMQARVLELLAGGSMTQRQIADALGLTQQGANRHVKALERRGLLAILYENGEWRCHAREPGEASVAPLVHA